MKKSRLLSVWALCLCLLAACAAPPADSGDPPQPGGAPSLAEGKAPAVLTLRVVDGAAGGNLLLAGESAGEVYALSVGEIPVRLDSGTEEDGAGVLEDGMVVDVAYNGTVLETWPAQLGEVSSITAWSQGSEKNPGGTFYDLCGLYLQVLEDLWERDAGLNSGDGLTYIGVDLSQAPGGLTEGEKAALAWRFAENHGKALVPGTFDQLTAQGYITGEPLDGSDAKFMQWEDGVLFSITSADAPADQAYSLPALFFNAQKWRSSLGAYYLSDCSCVWPETGTWTVYTVGSEAIS